MAHCTQLHYQLPPACTTPKGLLHVLRCSLNDSVRHNIVTPNNSSVHMCTAKPKQVTIKYIAYVHSSSGTSNALALKL